MLDKKRLLTVSQKEKLGEMIKASETCGSAYFASLSSNGGKTPGI